MLTLARCVALRYRTVAALLQFCVELRDTQTLADFRTVEQLEWFVFLRCSLVARVSLPEVAQEENGYTLAEHNESLSTYREPWKRN